MTEQPSVPSEPQIPAASEATWTRSAQPPAAGAYAPGEQHTDSPAGPAQGAAQQPYAPFPGAPDAPAGQPGGAIPDGFAQDDEHGRPLGPAGQPLPGTAMMPTAATAKKPNRAALIGGVGLAYLVLAAGTAAAVVAVASPAPVNTAALAGTSASAGATGTSSAGPSGPATTSAPATTAAPTPTSTVTGTVSGGVHHGDLRFFLLPAPDGPSSVQGAPDGTTENKSTVVGEYGSSSDSSQISSALGRLDFQGGATRTYQDSTLGANVTVELLQFGSHSDAKQWLGFFQGSVPTGDTKLTIPGESGSIGWSSSDDSTESYSLTGLFVEGDTFYNITVFGDQELDDSSLTNVMNDEYNRLANG
ncbi:MAG TPA: hypothetical protein VGX23_35285 [Actinocrinis sp.]|nr:hypothetical protein [Actinocrinis sp.]